MPLPARIKAIRLSKKLCQTHMCDILEIEQATYSGFEKDGVNLKFSTIEKVANALNCSIPFLTDVHSDIYDEKEWLLSKLSNLRN
jgi:transcriptional regulator with XRE-family HTH domain